MDAKRSDDPTSSRSWFRSDRLVQEGGNWYFLTREGTIEGPFESDNEARERLEMYARVMSLELISEDTEAALNFSRAP